MRKKVLRYGVGLILLIFVLAHATGRLQIGFIDSLDRLIYDARLRLTMPNDVDQRVVIVDIDEKSLLEIGRWPWRRDHMASLVNGLFEHYQIRLLGFDLVMAEPDESSGLRSLEALAQRELKGDKQFHSAMIHLRPQLDYDSLFAESLRGRPVILGYYFSNEGSTSGVLPRPALTLNTLNGRDGGITTWRNHGGNLAAFQQAAAGAGHFNPIIDADGSIRRVPLLARYENAYYQSFSLAMVRAYLNGATLQPQFGVGVSNTDTELESLLLSNTSGPLLTIPIDENVAAWVPYRGHQRSFTYFSAADVLAQRIEPEQLRGKIVIIGPSAPGLGDLRTTPVGEIYPGMEVHANLITGMLDSSIKQRSQYADAVGFLLLLGTGFFMIFFFPWRSPLWSTIATLFALLALAFSNLAFWQYTNWILPPATELLLMALLYMWNTSYSYFIESRTKLQIMQRFGQYVPPELVSKMSLDPGRYSMASRKAELTVLFSDVRGFTSISERLQPEELAQFMNEYLTAMTLIIRRHGGTLDKYVGDAIVAFWGAPVADLDHARNAVLAALDMQAELVTLNNDLAKKGWPTIQIGIGVNTGPMTVGDMGSSIRLAYTVMGDSVNLGARLESKTKDYGVGILVGEVTQAAAPGISFRELDRVQVKGKEEAVTIYEPLGRDCELTPALVAELAEWDRILHCYRVRDWTQAEIVLHGLMQSELNKPLYELYMQRIAAFRFNPPGSDWAGVTRFDTK
ncbi:MAG: adenylate/guanylate cyclase domain-containing protein [Cytophaga sp.]|nr:adenylate/guanylate cyclase domain-containing protein [Undibacterium sp.]